MQYAFLCVTAKDYVAAFLWGFQPSNCTF